MEYNRDSVENLHRSHLLERQVTTKDSNETNSGKVDTECSKKNGNSSRLPVDSEVSRLLVTVKKEGFVPSIKFEKLLLSRFYESVLEFVKHFNDESSLLYEVYLECVIIVSEKDEQFISYIENLNDDVCNHITEIARKEDYQYSKPEMYKLNLVFANLLITRISSKRSIFMGLSFHLVLLKAIKVRPQV